MPKQRSLIREAKPMDKNHSSASAHLRFPLFLDLTQKKIAVVGGGRIAARRVLSILDFIRQITVIAPEIRPELESLALENRIEIRKRAFQPDDLLDADLVITATGVQTVDEWVWRICREKHIPVNVSADQTKCDFFFPGIARQDSLVAGVTSCGTDHRLTKHVTQLIQGLLETLTE